MVDGAEKVGWGSTDWTVWRECHSWMIMVTKILPTKTLKDCPTCFGHPRRNENVSADVAVLHPC